MLFGVVLIQIFSNPLVWLLVIFTIILFIVAHFLSSGDSSYSDFSNPYSSSDISNLEEPECRCKDCKRLIQPGHVKHSDFDGRVLCESCYNKDIGRIVTTNHFR